jgi:hypothetical protein
MKHSQTKTIPACSPGPQSGGLPVGADPGSGITAELMQALRATNTATAVAPDDPHARIEGGITVHCRVDLPSRRVLEVATMATLFKGYESLLPGRGLHGVGRVSSTASGICGGVHATASALCLEMALGLTPPPLGIVVRNLLLSCQYLNDNCMHLFVLAGPDYSRETVEATHPELWAKASTAGCRWKNLHGYSHVGDIMVDLNKGSGALYRESLNSSPSRDGPTRSWEGNIRTRNPSFLRGHARHRRRDPGPIPRAPAAFPKLQPQGGGHLGRGFRFHAGGGLAV